MAAAAAAAARTPSSGRLTNHSQYSMSDERQSSGVSETVWLQPGLASRDRQRPSTLELPNKYWSPRIVDELAATAKSPDLKALIRYVGHGDSAAWTSHHGSDGHIVALQHCVRDATRRMTYFINAVNAVQDVCPPDSSAASPAAAAGSDLKSSSYDDYYDNDDDVTMDPTERRRRRRRRQARVITAAWLHRRLRAQCRTVSDDVLPAMVDALRAAMWPPSLAATSKTLDDFSDYSDVQSQLILVDETVASLQPCVEMVLVARRLLDEIDDVTLVTRLTSLVLAVAESLSRMRLAVSRSLVELPFSTDDRSPYDNNFRSGGFRPEILRATTGSRSRDCDAAHAAVDKMALAVYDDAGMTAGIPLASMEICDSAYRQIQRAGTSLESCYWTPIEDNDHLANLLATIVSSCYDIGSSMEEVSKSAECRKVSLFHQSVRKFADAVCRVMVTTAQIGLSRHRMLMAAKAVRHCASSLVTSARMLACDGQHPGSHGAFSAHSRALSRALTELVNCLSSMYLRSTGKEPANHVDSS